MNLISKILISAFIFIGFSACKKDNGFSNIPEIKLRDFYKITSEEAVWKIGFKDGDGDVGVRNVDDPDNFIVTIKKKKNGKDSLVQGQNYRVPIIKGVVTENGVEGEISLKIDYSLYKIVGIDSAYYSGYLVDRAGNHSNTIITPKFRI